MSQIHEVKGKGIVVRGNDIDTDRIIPARYLKEITFNRMGEFPFFDERFGEEGKLLDHPFNDARFKGAEILFVNRNFGCGSSREHAPQALFRWGIKAIVGESFGPIFSGNCVMIGVPTVTVSAETMEELMTFVEADPDTVISVNLDDKTISHKHGRVAFEMPESHHNALTTGSWDSAGLLFENMEQVERVARGLPYMDDFKTPAPL